MKSLDILIESQIFPRGLLPIWIMIPKKVVLEYPTFTAYSVLWVLDVAVYPTEKLKEAGMLHSFYLRGYLEPN